MDWLLQNILSALVWEVLLLIGVGAALGYLRAKWPLIASPVLYGIGGATCVGVLLFTFTGHGVLRKQLVEITPDNIEENLRTWTDHLAISLQRTPPTEARYFGYVARLQDANPVEVFRVKEKPGYLQFQATMTFSPEHQAALSQLSKTQSDKVMQELTLEVSRLRVGTVMASMMGPSGQLLQTTIVLQKALPIPNMNEGVFADSFDEMTRAVALVRAATSLVIGEASTQVAKPSTAKVKRPVLQ